MGRPSAYSFQDELLFIRGLGTWSTDPSKQPRHALIAGYVRGLRRRSIGFETHGGPITKEQLRAINDEVLALCRRLGLMASLDHVTLAMVVH